jgi:ABC-type Zn uptake system ZnuABC Zn-binding protein ZnuA
MSFKYREARSVRKRLFLSAVLFTLASLLLTACTSAATTAEGKLKLVASTTIVGDVVRQVAGESAALVVLIPPGADPHTFEPRPQDIAALSEADVVFTNGLHLEEALDPALESNVQGKLVAISDGIQALPFNAGAEHQDEAGHAAGDPHTWMDPDNVAIWVQNIAAALAQVDPQNNDAYQRNAEAYTAELKALDSWILEQTAQVPAAHRKLVSDHATFGYFAKAYGFEQVGLVVPALSTNAAPSAQELARLEDAIREQSVKAIFVDTTVNPALSQRVAADTGARVVFVYTGSLSEVGGKAGSYLDFMRYNVTAIVQALK